MAEIADTSLTFRVIGKDVNASRTLRTVGRDADRTKDRLDRLGESYLLSRTGLSGMATAAVALGPALLPVLAGATVAAGGLSTALAASGAAAGVFGAVAITSFTKVKEGVEDIRKAEDRLAKADTAKQRAAATRDLVQAKKALVGPLGQAATAYMRLGDAWKAFEKATEKQTFGFLVRGMNLLAAAVPKLRPLFDAGAEAFSRFLTPLERAVKSGGFDRFVKFLASQAGPALDSFGRITMNLGRTFYELLKAFAPMSQGVMRGLVVMTAGWARWASALDKSTGFQAFVDYVRQHGPLAWATLREIGRAAGNMVAGLAPLGPVVLAVVKPLASFVANVPPERIAAIAAGFAALAVAMKAASAGGAILTAIMALGSGPVGVVALALVALAAAFLMLYRNSDQVRRVLEQVGDYVRGTLWPALQQFGATVLPALREAWASIAKAIQDNKPELLQIAAGIGKVANFLITVGIPAWAHWVAAVIRAIGGATAFLISFVGSVVRFSNAVAGAINGAVTRIRAVWAAFWGSAFGRLVAAGINLATTVVRAGVGLIIATVRRIAAVAAIITSPFRTAVGGVTASVGSIVRVTAGIRGRIASAVGNLGSVLYNAGRQVVQGLINGINDRLGALAGAANRLAGVIARVVPGSPVREGPLTVLNRGRAGGLIATMLAEGIAAKAGAVQAALRSVMQPSLSAPTPVVGAVAGSVGTAGTVSAAGSRPGASEQPLIIQLMLDGRAVQQVLLKVKKENGGLALGLG